MRHKVALKKLNKTPAHRKAMIRNMLIALFREKRIKTTLAKAKVLRRFAEKCITRAKKDTVHNRRVIAKWVQDKMVLNSLFTELSPMYKERKGGYTRIVKIGPRRGDGAETAYIMLIEEETNVESPKKGKKKQLSSPKVVSPDKNTQKATSLSKQTKQKEIVDTKTKSIDEKNKGAEGADSKNNGEEKKEQDNKKNI